MPLPIPPPPCEVPGCGHPYVFHSFGWRCSQRNGPMSEACKCTNYLIRCPTKAMWRVERGSTFVSDGELICDDCLKDHASRGNVPVVTRLYEEYFRCVCLITYPQLNARTKSPSPVREPEVMVGMKRFKEERKRRRIPIEDFR